MLSTLDSYQRIYKDYKSPRIAVKKLLEIIDMKIEEERSNFVIFFSAPTGYGKSSCTIAIADAIAQEPNCLGERVIHVLPMRAIVEDLYRSAVDKQRKKRLYSNLTIGAQAMHIIDADKSPYMMPRLVYTTIDSFIHNLFKRPVAEMDKRRSHFDVPRYAIYSSMIIFDEAHLFSSESALDEDNLKKKHNRMFTAFVATLRALTEAHVPIIVMTATMPDSYIETLIKYCYGEIDIYTIEIGSQIESEEKIEKREISNNKILYQITLKDEQFYQFARENNPILKGLIEEDDIFKIVSKYLSYDNVRILIVRNTVKKAIEIFKRLKERQILPLIIHGRMTVGDREEVINEIPKDGKIQSKVVLVSTQVIEAGVDIDFDVLISDATVFTSLTQRVGRIGRKKRERPVNPAVYIVKSNGDGVYPEKFVQNALTKFNELMAERKELLWRIPERDQTDNSLISYKQILEDLYNEVDYSKTIQKEFFRALSEIDHFFVGSEARELQRKLCSFVREEGLIAASTWNEEKIETLEEAYKTLVAIPTYILRKRWEKLFKIYEGKVEILVKDMHALRSILSPDVYDILMELEKMRECAFLRNYENALRKFRKDKMLPIAVILRPDVYKQGMGLIIE